MNFKKSIIIIGIVALLISLFGFFIDTDIREQNLLLNLFEILMMTIVVATILSVIFYPVNFLLKS